jgi:hypothetical protein
MPAITELRRLKQLDHELEASLGYIMRTCQKEKRKERKEGREGKREG